MNKHPFTVVLVWNGKQVAVLSRHHTLSAAQDAAKRAFNRTGNSFCAVRTKGYSDYAVTDSTKWVSAYRRGHPLSEFPGCTRELILAMESTA